MPEVDLHDTQKRLLRFLKRQKPRSSVTVASMAKHLGRSHDAARRALHFLIQAGLVECERRDGLVSLLTAVEEEKCQE